MNLADHVGPRQDEEVVVALQVAGVLAESIAPELRLRQRVALDHRPHGAVEEEDPSGEQVVQPFRCRHGLVPLAISTAKGSRGLLAPTVTLTSRSPASRSSVSSCSCEKPR